jgi:hypothetical protein
VFQIYANDIDDIMMTKHKSIRIHPTFKRGGLSAMTSVIIKAFRGWGR